MPGIKKVFLQVAYDGTDFHGFQRQPGKRTIQGTLEEILSTINHENVDVHGAGRTDAGVHALGQVCHFCTNSVIHGDKFRYVLNNRLPRDIVIKKSKCVDFQFDAQKSAHWKTYRYDIDNSLVPNIRTRRYMLNHRHPLDIDLMQKAAREFIGTYDFTAFCSVKTRIENKVRTIYRCNVTKTGTMIAIEVTGNGFLYNMVRIIVGTLVRVGSYVIPVDKIPHIIANRNRKLAGPTFPPHGLTLLHVGYEPWSEDFS